MLTLSKSQLEKSQEIASNALTFLEQRNDDLAAAMVRYLWFDGDPNVVGSELAKYQNRDGGFGNRLEPDIHAPESNPFAARLAMQTMMCLPRAAHTDLAGKLAAWLKENQHEDGDWHFSQETRSGWMQPWFAAWEFPTLNPACCVVGWASMLGIATGEMLARVDTLFAEKASVEIARTGSFYELLPYVEYTLAVDLPDAYINAIAANVIAVGEGFDDAGHFFDLAMGGSDKLTAKIPDELVSYWVDKLLLEPSDDGGWPSPYNDSWRGWTTASNLVTLARLTGTASAV